MSISFSGKIVLVTGGTSGIGKAAAMALARKGATVIICGRDIKAGEMVTKEIKHLNGMAEFVEADISDSKQVDTLFSQIREKYKRLDCAFNAAGAEAEVAPLALQTEKHFDEMVSVDLKGTWLCMKNEIQIMQDQGQGCHCKLLLNGRSKRFSRLINLFGLQAWDHRFNEIRSVRICGQQYSHKFCLSRNHSNSWIGSDIQ